MKKKVLICGVGSIGERHLKNLLSLGYSDIILFRSKNKKLRTIKKKFPTFTNLSKALNQKPEIAIISNPTHLHLKTVMKCIQSQCHVFIEKPISHNLIGYKKIKELIIKHKRHVEVGYMMRYHPCIIQIKKWIDKRKIGKILHFKSEWGEYLPGWHPWEDYKISYAGKKEMGGGPILTLSHDIDLSLLFCGDIKNVSGNFNSMSELKVNTEDVADILITFKSGACANIHLNYLSRPSSRKINIIGAKGQILFDYYKNEAKMFIDGKHSKTYKVSKKFNRNDLFVDEIKHFLNKINKKNPNVENIDNAFKIVKIANIVKSY